MESRVAFRRAMEAQQGVSGEAECRWIKLCMLPGENRQRHEATVCKGPRERRELDRLGTRADDQHDGMGHRRPPKQEKTIRRRIDYGLSGLPAREARAAILAEVVGVGLELELHRRRGNDVVIEAVFLGVGDCVLLGCEGETHLGGGVRIADPASQRIVTLGPIAFEFERPLARLCAAALGGLAIGLDDAGSGHGGEVAQPSREIKSVAPALRPAQERGLARRVGAAVAG